MALTEQDIQQIQQIIQTYLESNLQKTKVSALPEAATLDGLQILGVSASQSVRASMTLLKGLDGKNVELRKATDYLEWRQAGGTWANLVSLADLKGFKVQLQKTATEIRQKYENDSAWTTLITLADLAGDSAYKVAVKNGYSGTEQQWLASLKGEPFKYTDFTSQQLAALKGETGKTPAIGAITASSVASTQNPSFSLTNSGNADANGNPVYTGSISIPKGANGADGKPPVFSAGATMTVAPDAPASATVTADGFTADGNPKFVISLSIPKGVKGDAGAGSGNTIVLNANVGDKTKQYVLKPSANGSLEYNIEEISLSWNNIIGKPATFAPSSHSHSASEVGGLDAALNGKAATNHTHGDYVPVARKVNNKALSADISLTASDVGAAASLHSHETATASANGLMSAADKEKLDNSMSKSTIFVDDLDKLTDNGIYRQEKPSSGYNYTTTINLTSSDGRQQVTIDREGSGLKFRGVNTGSGKDGWSAWKTAWHDGNDGHGSGLDADLLDGMQPDQLTVLSATYAPNASRLYSTMPVYAYDGSSPFYGYLTYIESFNRWKFQMYPESPAHIEVNCAESISEMRTNNRLKFWTGTQAQYDAITTKGADVLYIING